jgi:sugar fermentation stimulation protein A
MTRRPEPAPAEVAIKFAHPLRPGTLLKRYKRFLADVRCDDGETLTVACSNTGTMKSCSEPGRPVLLSYHPDGTRKYPYSWEMIRMEKGWVGVNTAVPNALVERALKLGAVPELMSFPTVRREIPTGESRLDFVLEGPPGKCYMEVKNVSLVEGDVICFPDAVTTRGLKHLEELIRLQRAGHRAVMMYVVQRCDGVVFRPADHIDPDYGQALRRARAAGVEVLVYRADVSPDGIRWGEPVRKDF